MAETISIARERDADFHTAEWGELYSEIGHNFRLSFQLSVYALIANGFIMAWVAQTNKDVFSPIVLHDCSGNTNLAYSIRIYFLSIPALEFVNYLPIPIHH